MHCILHRIPANALAPSTRYEKLIEAFGGTGYIARTVDELHSSLKEAMADTEKTSIVNVMINPMAQRKTQVCYSVTVHVCACNYICECICHVHVCVY